METPLLATPRFDMMRLRQKDAGAMFSRWMTDKEVARYSAWNPHKDVSETYELVAQDIKRNESEDFYSWGLFFDDFTHGSNRPRIFGHATLHVNIEENMGSIGYVLMRPEWGKGYATEAVQAITGFALSRLGLEAVTAAVHVQNKASCRVLEKVGYTMQYQFQAPSLSGAKVPMVRYQITRDAYYAE